MDRQQPESGGAQKPGSSRNPYGAETWPQPESVQCRNLAAAGIHAAQKTWAVPGNRPVRAGSI
ncbi:hypothetical protein K250101E9_51390 [Enterocloster aldenensis]|uniref:hypothetical protein n=1 Tax=Enterocloster aldenensis TaxID=358742 RepID=UPI0034BD5A0A